MPSPFPGMDPFLEYRWGDVHTSLTTYTRNQLRTQMPDDLRVRVEEYEILQVVNDDFSDRPPRIRKRPDVKIVEGLQPKTSNSETVGVVAAVPVVVPLETETLRRVQITESKTGRLVTVIEFLSYANKVSEGRIEYLQKQQSFWEAGVNLVEIDLLRRGPWAMSLPEPYAPEDCRYPYRIIVKSTLTWAAECYRTSIQDPLPAISVPLREGDPPAILQVQPLIAAAWQDGDYDDIDYAREPLPPFNAEDTQWIHELLMTQGFDRSQAKIR